MSDATLPCGCQMIMGLDVETGQGRLSWILCHLGMNCPALLTALEMAEDQGMETLIKEVDIE